MNAKIILHTTKKASFIDAEDKLNKVLEEYSHFSIKHITQSSHVWNDGNEEMIHVVYTLFYEDK